MKANTVFLEGVAKLVLEDPKDFEPPVDCFMPGPDKPLPLPLLCIVKVSPWCIKIARVASVSFVSHSTLIPLKLINKVIESNLQIRPLTTGKGSVDPHNIASLNGNAHLIPHSRSIELLAVPLLGKGLWLLYLKVCTINSNLASGAIVENQPILPLDLES
jgi:hypothetical protein